jgi:hypothetical protein
VLTTVELMLVEHMELESRSKRLDKELVLELAMT